MCNKIAKLYWAFDLVSGKDIEKFWKRIVWHAAYWYIGNTKCVSKQLTNSSRVAKKSFYTLFVIPCVHCCELFLPYVIFNFTM